LSLTGIAPHASALTITGNYLGGSFSAVPYYTCGPDWNCADPSTHSPSVQPTAQWVVDTFNAAASYWEQRIDDPWTVNISYGWTPLGSTSGVTVSGSSQNGCLTSASGLDPGRI